MHVCTDTHSILRELMATGKLICAVCVPIDLHYPRSTFVFQIGAPRKQVVRLLPATSMVETYVVSSRGCEVPGWDRNDCVQKRGGVFTYNQSATWIDTMPHKLDDMAVFQRYGLKDMGAEFGRDTISPGYVDSGNVVVPSAVVGGVLDVKYFVMGQFGLRPEPTNFTDKSEMNAGQRSFMQRLKVQKSIASLSYGYTAGAYYRKYHDMKRNALRSVLTQPEVSPGTPGSLTMGGYDANRRTGKEASFPMYPDIEWPLMVRLHTVVINARGAAPTTNLLSWSISTILNSTMGTRGLVGGSSTAIPMRIDSGTPFIYLPEWTCDAIESLLGLQHDKNDPGGYYFLPESSQSKLMNANASMGFVINGLKDSSKDSAITITLPFAALVQELSYPLSQETVKYIPIKKATNPEQYVLGRTFLQEAYLTADYERQRFSLHQAYFPYPPTEKLVALKAPFSKMMIGAIAGGAGALILLILTAVFFLRRIKQRRRLKAAEKEAEAEATRIKIEQLEISPDSPSSLAMKIMEIDSETVHEIGGMPRHQVQEIGVPVIHGELPDQNTIMSDYEGFFKEVVSERHEHPIIKVYYEMDGTPPRSEEGAPTGTLSSAGTTLIESPGWSSTGGSQSYSPGSTLWPLRNHRRVVSDGTSPIPQTPAEFYDRRPVDFFNRLNDQRAGPSSSRNPHIGNMSPIPQTPLEYYGTAARPGAGGNRGWIGGAPPDMPVVKGPLVKKVKSEEKVKAGEVEVPRVVLIPATPSEMSEKERERRRWLRGNSRMEGEGRGNGKGKMREGG